MNGVKENIRNSKGGRPRKAVRKTGFIGVRCTAYQQALIRAKAKAAGISASAYLCELGENSKIVSPKRALPAEVLKLTGTLNHLAANLNQVARKRNSFDPLDALERAQLELDSREIKQLVLLIKNYLQ